MKLFLQTKGTQSTNCALHGNASTYRFNNDEIASMIEGNIMPNSLQVIASTIGVTIIGPKNVCEQTMSGFLWVCRSCIHAALVWLKANNPLYADIIISDEQLEMLMENRVPEEISAAMRHSDNIEELEQEHVGYVPEDDKFTEVFTLPHVFRASPRGLAWTPHRLCVNWQAAKMAEIPL